MTKATGTVVGQQYESGIAQISSTLLCVVLSRLGYRPESKAPAATTACDHIGWGLGAPAHTLGTVTLQQAFHIDELAQQIIPTVPFLPNALRHSLFNAAGQREAKGVDEIPCG